MAFTPKSPQRILFFGDSITQYGLNEGGYLVRLQTWLKSNQKEAVYTLLGAGISGNKIYDLYLRIEDDVLAKHPDVVVVFEGVNDVWHKTSMGTGTDLDKYEKFYRAILQKLKAQNIRIVLVTPACMGEKKDNGNPQDAELNKYCEVIRRLAISSKATLLDFRKIVQQYESVHNVHNRLNGVLTTDGVHLNDAGNQLLAEEMRKVLAL